MPIINASQFITELDRSENLCDQLALALRQKIQQGILEAGTRLPATRALANELEVSRTTTQLAYDQLSAEGYIVSRRGCGTFIADMAATIASLSPKPASGNYSGLSAYGQSLLKTDFYPYFDTVAKPEKDSDFDFRCGLPDANLFPHKQWLKAQRKILRSTNLNHMHFLQAQGVAELRKNLVRHLKRNRGLHCREEQILVTSGFQQNLQIMMRILCEKRDQILTEYPGYPVVETMANAEGLQVSKVEVDESGISVSDLEKKSNSNARLLYVTPSHQYPLGVVLPVERRRALIAWANKRNTFILEDDYDGEFRYAGAPIEALMSLDDNERVVFMGSFSKTMSVGIRLGFMVLPESLVEAAAKARWCMGGFNQVIDQLTMAALIADGTYDKHVKRCKLIYSKRRKELIGALSKSLKCSYKITGDQAGLHLTIWIPGLNKTKMLKLIAMTETAGLRISALVNRQFSGAVSE
ncbi:MAG: hypothetical protein COA96_15215, partial [SAR86 cluster bacterium]